LNPLLSCSESKSVILMLSVLSRTRLWDVCVYISKSKRRNR